MDKNTLHSSFGKWISPINFQKLHEQVEIHKQDYYTKKLTTESSLKLLLFSHLQETESLHALSDALLDTDLQKTVGFESISVSQLSRKNNSVEPAILSRVFLELVQKIQQFHQKRVKLMPLKVIDSSTLPLNLTQYKWAKFRKTKAGVKLHLRLVFMDEKTIYPDKAIITTAKEHDRGQLEVLVDDKEAMYVFDRGYVGLAEQFVILLKRVTPRLKITI